MRRPTDLHRYLGALDALALALGYGVMLAGVGWIIMALLRAVGVMQ